MKKIEFLFVIYFFWEP